MKKILSAVSLGWIAFLYSAGIVFAGAAVVTDPDVGDCGQLDSETIALFTIKSMLIDCKPKKVIATEGDDYAIDGGARKKVIAIANQLILAGSILSVGAIVYAGVLYTIAAGDDERIKKAKGSLKFGIIGFTMMLLSFPLVNAIINLIYSTSGP